MATSRKNGKFLNGRPTINSEWYCSSKSIKVSKTNSGRRRSGTNKEFHGHLIEPKSLFFSRLGTQSISTFDPWITRSPLTIPLLSVRIQWYFPKQIVFLNCILKFFFSPVYLEINFNKAETIFRNLVRSQLLVPHRQLPYKQTFTNNSWFNLSSRLHLINLNPTNW